MGEVRVESRGDSWIWVFSDRRNDVELESNHSYGDAAEAVAAARSAYPKVRIVGVGGSTAELSGTDKAWIATGILSVLVSLVMVIFFMKD